MPIQTRAIYFGGGDGGGGRSTVKQTSHCLFIRHRRLERTRVALFLQQNQIVKVVNEYGREYDVRALFHVLTNPFGAVFVEFTEKMSVLSVDLV